jgi:hypothetical protein
LALSSVAAACVVAAGCEVVADCVVAAGCDAVDVWGLVVLWVVVGAVVSDELQLVNKSTPSKRITVANRTSLFISPPFYFISIQYKVSNMTGESRTLKAKPCLFEKNQDRKGDLFSFEFWLKYSRRSA